MISLRVGRVSEVLCRLLPQRTGGTTTLEEKQGGGTKVGQIPDDPRSDFEFMEMEILQVVDKAKSLGLPIIAGTIAAVQQRRVRFTLAAERTDRLPNPAVMLDIRGLGSLLKPGSASPCASYLQSLPPPKGNGKSDRDSGHSTCQRMRHGQSTHYIDLTLENVRSILKDRWADSAVLNAAMHLLLEFYPEKDSVFLNSAQLDFNWSDLAKTPRCYSKVASCLYLDSHWTMGFIDHDTREIWYDLVFVAFSARCVSSLVL